MRRRDGRFRWTGFRRLVDINVSSPHYSIRPISTVCNIVKLTLCHVADYTRDIYGPISPDLLIVYYYYYYYYYLLYFSKSYAVVRRVCCFFFAVCLSYTVLPEIKKTGLHTCTHTY